jgi:hypothetical protein
MMPTKKPTEAAKPNLEQFAEEWTERQELSSDHIRDIGFYPAECDCGAKECTGVQMVHPNDPAHHYH